MWGISNLHQYIIICLKGIWYKLSSAHFATLLYFGNLLFWLEIYYLNFFILSRFARDIFLTVIFFFNRDIFFIFSWEMDKSEFHKVWTYYIFLGNTASVTACHINGVLHSNDITQKSVLKGRALCSLHLTN